MHAGAPGLQKTMPYAMSGYLHWVLLFVVGMCTVLNVRSVRKVLRRIRCISSDNP
jgi:hypothetical protein